MDWMQLYKTRGLQGIILGIVGIVVGMVCAVVISTTYAQTQLTSGNTTWVGSNIIVYGAVATFFGLGLMAYAALVWFKGQGGL